MDPKRHHNISLPTAIILMACASLIFFLPVAISMNASSPGNPAPTILGSSVCMDTFVGRDVAVAKIDTATCQGDTSPKKTSTNVSVGGKLAEENKKGSLSLKTAAMIGSSSVVSAAVLAVGDGRSESSPQNPDVTILLLQK